jgi:DNA-directed RNA polymerase specialized sigma24 family protein
MQDQIALSDEATGPDAEPGSAPAIKRVKRRNPEQLAADRALYERLQHDKFVGRAMEQLRQELWVYGWKVLRAWMRDGTLVEKCGERHIPVPARWHEIETLKQRSDIRDEIAHDAVQGAVALFTEEFLPAGQWDPDKGATMRTYFTVTCMFAFRDAFKKWASSHRRHLAMTASNVLDGGRVGRNLPPDEAAVYRWTIQRILQDATWEARAICSLIYEQKMTQKEIGDELGMTSRAVEGHMRRLRTRARTLTARGEIEALYGRLASVEAGAR